MIDLREYTINNTKKWDDSLRNRVKIINDASVRSRYTLFFTALLSVGLSLAMFAYFYSWNKNFAYNYQNELKTKGTVSENIIRDGVIKEWQSTQTYQLPILGLKIMASDLPLIAPIAMLVITTWLYFVVRREHYSVGRILNDAYFVYKEKIKKKNPEAIIMCQELYHSIIGSVVFNVIPYDKTISNLDEMIESSYNIKKKSIVLLSRTFIIKMIVFLPLISVLFIASIRLLTFIGIKSTITNNTHDFHNLTLLRQSLVIISICFTILGILFCYFNARKILKFIKSSRKLLDDYQLWAFYDNNM